MFLPAGHLHPGLPWLPTRDRAFNTAPWRDILDINHSTALLPIRSHLDYLAHSVLCSVARILLNNGGKLKSRGAQDPDVNNRGAMSSGTLWTLRRAPDAVLYVGGLEHVSHALRRTSHPLHAPSFDRHVLISV